MRGGLWWRRWCRLTAIGQTEARKVIPNFLASPVSSTLNLLANTSLSHPHLSRLSDPLTPPAISPTVVVN